MQRWSNSSAEYNEMILYLVKSKTSPHSEETPLLFNLQNN